MGKRHLRKRLEVKKWKTKYFVDELVRRFAISEKRKAKQLLLNFDYLCQKIEHRSVNSLLNDFNYIEDITLQTIQDAIRLSAHIIENDSVKLGQQLIGRLQGFKSDEIQQFLQQIQFISSWLKPSDCGLRKPVAKKIKERAINTSWEGLSAIHILTNAIRSSSQHKYSVFYSLPLKDLVLLINYKLTELQLWDIEKGKLVSTFYYKGIMRFTATTHIPETNLVIIALQEEGYSSSDLKRKTNNFLILFDTKNMKEVFRFDHEGQYEIYTLCSIPHQNILLAYGGTKIYFFNLKSGLLIQKTDLSQVINLSIESIRSYQATKVFLSTTTATTLWDFSRKRVEKSFTTADIIDMDDPQQALALTDTQAFVPLFEKKRFISANTKEIILWDIETQEKIKSYSIELGVPVSSIDNSVYILLEKDSNFWLLNTETGERSNFLEIQADNAIQSKYLRNKQKFICLQTNGLVRIWDISLDEVAKNKNTPAQQIKESHNKAVTEIISIPSENRVISYSATGKTILIHELKTNKVLFYIKAHEDDIVKVLYHTEKKIFISASKDKSIKIWDLNNGVLLKHMIDEHEVLDIVIMLNRELMLSATKHGAHLWYIDSGYFIKSYHFEALYDVELIPLNDKEHFVVLLNKSIQLFNIQSYKPRKIIEDIGEIYNYALSLTGKYLFIATGRTYSKLWDLEKDVFTDIYLNSGEKDTIYFDECEEHLIKLSNNSIQKINILNQKRDHITSISGVPLNVSPDFSLCLINKKHELQVYDIGKKKKLAYYNGDSDFMYATIGNQNEIIAGDKSGNIHFLQCMNFDTIIQKQIKYDQKLFSINKRKFFTKPYAYSIPIKNGEIEEYVEKRAIKRRSSLKSFFKKRRWIEETKLSDGLYYLLYNSLKYINKQSLKKIISFNKKSTQELSSILNSQSVAQLFLMAKKQKLIKSYFDIEGGRKLKNEERYGELYPIILALCYNSDIDELHRSLKYSQNPFPWLIWADRKLKQGIDLIRIEYAYKQALLIDPDYEYAWVQLAKLYTKQLYRFDEAIKIYQCLSKNINSNDSYKNYKNKTYLFEAGVINHKYLKKYSEAEGIYLKLLDITTGDVYWFRKCWERLYDLYLKCMRDDIKTINASKELLKLSYTNPSKRELLTSIGDAYNHLKQYQKAEDFYQKAMKECKDEEIFICKIWEKLGDMYFSTKDYNKAVTVIEKVLNVKNYSGEWWALLAYAYHIGLNQPEKAEAAYKNGINHFIEDSSLKEVFYKNYISLLENSNRKEEAEKFQKKIKMI